MRHPRLTVFAGAIAALAVMSLLSSLLGTIVPTLLPKRYTTVAAALLFFVFGLRMLQEGLEMEAGEKGREKMEEEMREVQKEVEEAEEEASGKPGAQSYNMTDLEEGRISPAAQASPSAAPTRPVKSRRGSISIPSREDALTTLKEGFKNLCHLFFSPIFIQAFILTFLAEWGDRSQITTIALAAAHVRFCRHMSLSTHVAHALDSHRTCGLSLSVLLSVIRSAPCSPSSVAVGSRNTFRSSTVSRTYAHVSPSRCPPADAPLSFLVTLGGAVLFLIFGLIYSYEAYNWEEEVVAGIQSVTL